MAEKSLLDAIAERLFIALCFTLPFFFIPVPWATIGQGKVVLVAALLLPAALLWCMARVREGAVRIPASRVLLFAALVPVAYCISSIVSGVSALSLVGTGIEQDTLAAACLWYGVLALAAVIFSESSSRVTGAMRAFFLGALLLLIFQVVHLLFPSAPLLGGLLGGQTGNAFGGWHEFSIALGAFLFLGLILEAGPIGDGVWKYVLVTVSALSGLLLVSANFPDVWVGVGVLALLFLLSQTVLTGKFRKEDFSWQPYASWIALVVIAVLFSVFGTFVNGVLPDALSVESVEVRPSWQGTLQVGQLALTQPATLVFGAGPNTFTRAWNLYKPAGVNQTLFWNVDFNAGVGSVPTSFITVGLLGVLAWIAMIAGIGWFVARLFLSPAREGNLVWSETVKALGFAVLYLLAFHVLYVPGPALNVMTFLLAGFLLGTAVRSRYSGIRTMALGWSAPLPRIGHLAGTLLFTLAVLGAGLGVVRVVGSEMLLNRSVVLYSDSQDLEGAVRSVNAALRVYPGSDRAHRAAVEVGLLRLQQLAAEVKPDDAESQQMLQKTLEETIQHGLTAVSINGSDYQNWLGLAALFQELAGAKVQGAYDNARKAYERARADSPTNPLPLLRLAQLELIEEHTDPALRLLEQAVELKVDFAPAYYLASQIYASRNDLQSAFASASNAAQYAQSDPQAWYNLGSIAYAGNRYADAVTALERALALQPQYANALYVLALSYYETHRDDDALNAFEQLAKLDSTQSIVMEALDNLRAGNPPLPQMPPRQ